MRTLRIGLIGDNISQSRFPAAMAAMCAARDIALDFTPIETSGATGFRFNDEIDALRANGWDGISVTHPWKPAAARWADGDMTARAAELGAANLLTFRPVAGYNTDYSGFLGAWRAVMDRSPGSVAVAGAGGVARAVVPALFSLGAGPVTVWDRDPARARSLAAATGARAVSEAEAPEAVRSAEGVVNCTPLGMAPDTRSAFNAGWLGTQVWAFDAVYTPVETPFLRAARAAGLNCLTGFDLFRFMALASFAAYTGHPPDPDRNLPLLDALRPPI
ncbi:Quinate/shikimate dehydrogenase [Jannaschia seosinensis]|uniref:Quinate/shikimate dehydrogenase n=1 Tax=Jannaschia seosinensis TaxID=313367 RepID=A0A0M7B874_9RHOB|nr:NAD(P)-binding domain-containing protein [Jannaschia seosinensis]CUH25732.1 Quinate/shikimate dehydrogenase [Jannaschia seosinensis]